MRKNCETDWKRLVDVQTYAEFFGHTPEVALKHYTRAEDQDFEKISGKESGPRTK